MSSVETMARPRTADGRLALPIELDRRLRDFRGLVWRIKLAEAACGAACGVAVCYLLVFGLDRFGETPRFVRGAIFLAALAACAAVPVAFHRWIWQHRSLEQVARLIARRFPSLGDQLLGIIEIVRTAAEPPEAGRTTDGSQAPTGSRTLCEAAIVQVSERAATFDFRAALPRARHRLWAALAVVPLVVAALLAAGVPAAAFNAWLRFVAPWRVIERYTFTRIAGLPERLVVPQGEPSDLAVTLAADTRSRPRLGTARITGQPPLTAVRQDDTYAFNLPPQLAPAALAVSVGDVRRRIAVEPMLRPEITAVTAEVVLPGYLERSGTTTQDVRAGAIAPVEGSLVTLVATANRDLAAAEVDGVAVTPSAASVRTLPLLAEGERSVVIAWRDGHGLTGGRPLTVAITPRKDAAPTVAMIGAPASREMLLDTDTLRFSVAARDDFGTRAVGLAWQGQADEAGKPTATGEKLLEAGGSDRESLDVAATFCPRALGVAAQPIVLRAFVEDYLPGRGRVYSPPVLLYIVDEAEHALILNERLNRWRQQAGEVRDREMGLLAANRELRNLSEKELLEGQARSRIETQAAA